MTKRKSTKCPAFSFGCRDASHLIYIEHVEVTSKFTHSELKYLNVMMCKTVCPNEMSLF